MLLLCLLMFWRLLLWASVCAVTTPTHRLKVDILSRDYDSSIRPTLGDDDVTIVTVIPNQFILLLMDQQQETVRFLGEFMLSWIDPYLTWNQTQFQDYGRDWLKIPEMSVWTPDVIFDQAIFINERIPLSERVIDLHYDGTLRQSNPSVVEFPCQLRIEDFPYDVQVCNLTIGPWNFDTTQVLIKAFGSSVQPDLDRFDGNSEWELISMTAYECQDLEELSGNNYSYINYKVTLKRKPVYYVLVIQAPTFIFATLTIFGIFTPFNQECERVEKVTLGLNMFVSISMMLNLVSDMMPKAARLPLLGNYILSEIFVCAAAVIVSIIILILHQKCHTRLLQPPQWLIRILLFQCSSKINVQSEPREIETIKISTRTNFPANKTFTGLKTIQKMIQKSAQLIATEVSYSHDKHKTRRIWTSIFDRLDLFLLAIFQILNVIVSILYMR